MSDVDPPICSAVDPVTGFRCGLFEDHPKFPHRLLRADFPYVDYPGRVEWDAYARWVMVHRRRTEYRRFL